MLRAGRLVVLCSLAAVAPGVVAATAQGATSKPGGAHRDAPEGAAIDIASVALGQRLRDLTLVVTTREPLTPRLLSDTGGGELCVSLEPAGAARRLCVTRAGGAWELRVGDTVVKGTVGQLSPTRMTVRVPVAAVGLQRGALHWSVTARAAGCATTARGAQVVAPDGPTGATGPTGPTEPQVPCGDRAPDSGTYRGRVWKVVVSGCDAKGATEVRHGPPAGKRVALTYDDGPGPLTPQFLTQLKALGVPATFFLIGRQVAGQGPVLRRMLADGDMIGNHTWDHAIVGGGGPGATSEIESTNAAIRTATGFTPCLFRPPTGASGPDLQARVRALGMTSVQWSVDPSDYLMPGTPAIVGRVLGAVAPGGIILSHDGGGERAGTLGALPQIVHGLKARGYTFVTVTELLGYDQRVALTR